MPKAIKIKTDYVPKSKQKGVVLKTAKTNIVNQICPRCNASIPADEMNKHMRIELIDPKWREQKKRFLDKQKDSNLLDTGLSIAQNLKNFAEFRADIFGGNVLESEKKLQEQKTKAIQKERVIWDGHTNSIQSVTAKSVMSIDEQIATLNATIEAKEKAAIGPRVPTLSSSINSTPANTSSSFSSSSAGAGTTLTPVASSTSLMVSSTITSVNPDNTKDIMNSSSMGLVSTTTPPGLGPPPAMMTMPPGLSRPPFMPNRPQLSSMTTPHTSLTLPPGLSTGSLLAPPGLSARTSLPPPPPIPSLSSASFIHPSRLNNPPPPGTTFNRTLAPPPSIPSSSPFSTFSRIPVPPRPSSNLSSSNPK